MNSKFKILIFIFAFSSLNANVFAKKGSLPNWYIKAIKQSEMQLLAATNEFKNSTMNPRTYEHGKVTFVPITDWTCGFFPGTLWYSYELTKNEQLKSQAKHFTSLIEDVKYRTNTHDVGFMLYCSYGNGFRITADEHYKDVLITGAKSLMTRYFPKIGMIRSWDKRQHWEFSVIIDNMMNLELLSEVGKMTNNKIMINAAISHADRTMQNHFRPDNSCFHVVNYDSINGNVISKETHQGFADSTSWARGQAWALYGYTMMYRETKSPKYLLQAHKVADFILNHPNLPKDKIPYWDFDAPKIPNEPRDASAAAIIASALLELSTFENTNTEYFKDAEYILLNLSSSKYLAKVGENGFFILKHSTGNWPKNSEVDTALSYADYYYLEAMKRYAALKGF